MKWNKENIEQLNIYVSENKSRIEIAKLFNVSEDSIRGICYKKNLKTKEKEFYCEFKCVNCGIKFIGLISEDRKFCSKKCSASYNNTKRILSINTKDKIKKSILLKIGVKKPKCLECDNDVKKKNGKYCSNNCKNKSILYKDTVRDLAIKRYKKFPELHPNKLCANVNESFPEQMVRKFFEMNGLIKNVDFIPQYNIGNYYVDFYLNKINIGVEVDGEYWHDCTNPKEIKRQEYIEKSMILIRLKAKKILKKEYETLLLDLITKSKSL